MLGMFMGVLLGIRIRSILNKEDYVGGVFN